MRLFGDCSQSCALQRTAIHSTFDERETVFYDRNVNGPVRNSLCVVRISHLCEHNVACALSCTWKHANTFQTAEHQDLIVRQTCACGPCECVNTSL